MGSPAKGVSHAQLGEGNDREIGETFTYNWLDTLDDINFDETLPVLLEALEADARLDSSTALLNVRLGSHPLQAFPSNLSTGLQLPSQEQLPSMHIRPPPSSQQPVAKSTGSQPAGEGPGVLKISVNSGNSQLWLNKAYNPFYVPFQQPKRNQPSMQHAVQVAKRQQPPASEVHSELNTAPSVTPTLFVPNSSASAPAGFTLHTGATWRPEGGQGCGGQQWVQQAQQQLAAAAQLSIAGEPQAWIERQEPQQPRETSAGQCQPADAKTPAAVNSDQLFLRLMHLGTRQLWDPPVLLQEHTPADCPPTASVPASHGRVSAPPSLPATLPTMRCGGCGVCFRCIELAAMKVATQQRTEPGPVHISAGGGAELADAATSAPATHKGHSLPAPSSHPLGGSPPTQASPTSPTDQGSFIPPAGPSIPQRSKGEGKGRERLLGLNERHADGGASSVSPLPGTSMQTVSYTTGGRKRKLPGKADASQSQGMPGEVSMCAREKARERARRARAKKQKLIDDLSAENKSLRRRVRRLYRCMQLWGSQGFLTEVQAREFLVQGQQSGSYSSDSEESDSGAEE